MKKRCLQIMMAVAVMVLMLTFGVSAKGDFAYKYSGKAYDASIKYLNEFYLKKHPDFALRNSYSAPNDWEYLEKALVPIIKGCKTDREKADAIALWVKENIKYVTDTFSFPKDVYVAKKGDCISDSYLIQQFLRMCDIPAVVCVGWRGDLVSTVDKEFIDSDADSRHAWTMAYIDGQWLLYDILFDVYAEADRDFITKWYFFESLEGVSPYYGEDGIVWHFGGSGCFYRNGKFYCYYQGKPTTQISLLWNDFYHQMNSRAYEKDNHLCYYDSSRKNPDNYEAFTDGFIKYDEMGYPMFCALYNGIMPTATINQVDGQYYLFGQGGGIDLLLNHLDEYYMINSAVYMADGELLPVYPVFSEYAYKKGYKIRYTCVNPEQAYVDEEGRVHLKEGYDIADTQICMDAVGEDGTLFCGDGFNVIILSEKYQHDEDNDYHTYATVSCTPATEKKAGKITKKCTGCSKTISYGIPAIKKIDFEGTKFAYTGEEITPYVKVKDTEGKELVYGMDYTITCKNNKAIGKGTVTVKFKGKYSGTVSKTFEIKLAKTEVFELLERKSTSLELNWYVVEGATEYRLYVYDEKKDKYVLLKKTKETEYRVEGLEPGKTYKFRVRALRKTRGKTYKGDYSYITAETKPAKVKMKMLTSTKAKQAVVVWTPVSGANGYQVKYSTSKKFTKKTTKSVTVKKQKSKKVTLKKLKKGKKYYVKLRAYKTVNGKKIFGAYSKVKTVKVK